MGPGLDFFFAARPPRLLLAVAWFSALVSSVSAFRVSASGFGRSGSGSVFAVRSSALTSAVFGFRFSVAGFWRGAWMT